MNRFFPLYLKKIFLFGIILGIIPSLVIGISFFIYSYRNFMKDVPVRLANSLHQAQTGISQAMEFQQRQINAIISDTDVAALIEKKYSYHFDFMLYNEVYKKISGLYTYDTDIIDFCFVNLKNDWLISTAGTYYIENRDMKIYLENIIPDSETSKWLVDYEDKNFIIPWALRWLQKDAIKYIHNFSNYAGHKNFISVSISSEWYSSKLAVDRIAENILIIDGGGRIVAAKKRAFNGLFLADTPYKEISANLGSIDAGFVMNKKSLYAYSFLKDRLTGWNFVYVSNVKNALAAIFFLRNISLIIAFFLIVSIILFAFLRAKAIYRPLEKDLEEQVSYQSELSRKLFIHHLLNGIITEDDIDEKIRLFKFPDCPQCCRVVLIQAEFFDEYTYEQRCQDLLSINLANMAAEELAEYLCFPSVIDGGSVILITGANMQRQKFREEMAEKLETLQEKIRNVVHADAFMCVSTEVPSYKAISRHRFETNEMFKYNPRYSRNGILFREDIELPVVIYSPYPQQLEDALHAAIRQGNIQETYALLKQFISLALKDEDLRQRYFFTLSRLLWGILRLSQEYFIDGGKGLSILIRDHEQLYSLTDRKKIFKWIKDYYIDPLYQAVQLSASSPQDTKMIEKMKEIVKKRYHEYLSIEILSCNFSYSPSYLRRIFRQGTGITFNEYLNDVRIDAAKKMLTETRLRINAVAKKLTYQNSQSFIRIFHKKTGVSPGMYRRLHGPENNSTPELPEDSS